LGVKKKCIPYYRIFIENQMIFPYNGHKKCTYEYEYNSTYESLGVHIEKMTNSVKYVVLHILLNE